MKAAILAAGIGRRLSAEGELPPKALLRFAGRSLLERHLDMLMHAGVAGAEIVTGYRAQDIEREIRALGARDYVATRLNPDYRSGPIVSLWTLRELLRSGEDILFMDADVLYDRRLLERLIESRHRNCLPIDRHVEPGEDPVKVCLQGGRIVDFHKRPSAEPIDFWGEWVGFMRLDPAMAARLADACDAYIEAGRSDAIYEDPMRDVILESGAFGVEDITGLPWIEIDFPEDLARAEREILPHLLDAPPAQRGKSSPSSP